MKKTGILLLNLGTPSEPTPEAVREFLEEFLNDPYVVDYPGWLWKPILNNIILMKRPARVAEKYQKIWWEDGSPLMIISERIKVALSELMSDFSFALGMRYGEPSTQNAIETLLQKGVEAIIVFPLFPQFTHSTSASIIDHALKQIDQSGFAGEVKIIRDYFDHPAYISALSQRIQDQQKHCGKPDKLVFSYHSIPNRYIKTYNDPYIEQCARTTELVAAELGLAENDYQMVYQSRFGIEPWVGPMLNDEVRRLAVGKQTVDVICPGFAVDGLETLEEVAIEGKWIYEEENGPGYGYISALNDSDIHVKALARIISDKLKEG